MSQKGGVGKTTAIFAIAHAMAFSNIPVACEDLDPQGSFAATIRNPPGTLAANLKAEQPVLILRDTPGHLDLETPAAAQAAALWVAESDIVLVVSKLGGLDVRAAAATGAFVKNHLRPGARAHVLWNMVRTGTVVGQQDRDSLARVIGIPSLRTYFPLSAALEKATTLAIGGQNGWGAITGEDRTRVLQLVTELLAVSSPTE